MQCEPLISVDQLTTSDGLSGRRPRNEECAGARSRPKRPYRIGRPERVVAGTRSSTKDQIPRPVSARVVPDAKRVGAYFTIAASDCKGFFSAGAPIGSVTFINANSFT